MDSEQQPADMPVELVANTEKVEVTQEQAGTVEPETEELAGTESPEEGFKKHARTWERRAKQSEVQLEQMREKLAGAEKALGEAEAAREEALAIAKQAEQATMRYKAGRAAGLPIELCERLRGETLEEMEQDAMALSKMMGRSALNLSELSGGADPTPKPRIDAAKIAANMPTF